MKTCLKSIYAFLHGMSYITVAGSANYKNTLRHKIQQRNTEQSIAFYWVKTGKRIKTANNRFAIENKLNHAK